MNEKARQWVDYLKTNPPKTQETLIDKNDFTKRCCLGHALNFVSHDSKEEKRGALTTDQKKELNLHTIVGGTDRDGILETLQYKGKDLIGLDDFEVNSLARLNDHTNFNHREIAEIIEENEDILFRKEIK